MQLLWVLYLEYKNGKIDGIRKDWYKNGQLKNERTYKNGELDGVWKVYLEDGQLKEEKTFKDGKKI